MHMADAQSHEGTHAAEIFSGSARSCSEKSMMPYLKEALARAQSERNGAVRFGEKAVDQAMHYAFKVRDLRRAMYKARYQLKVGKTAEARQTIEKALADDDR
jgi:hypothetical protein